MKWHIGLCILVMTAYSACAQPAAEQFRGTVTLRGGEALTGTILLAEFGVVVGAGIGTMRPDLGSICLDVDGQQVTVAGRDVWLVEATWEQKGDAANPTWEITGIGLTKRDGQKLSGRPTWLLHGTTARVMTDDGELHRISTVQPEGEGFSPDALIAGVLVGDQWPAGAGPQPEVAVPAGPPAATVIQEPAPTTGGAPVPGMSGTGVATQPTFAGPEPVSPMSVAAADDLYGTITLRGGQRLSGAIKTAEFGAAAAAAIGAQFEQRGALTLNLGAETATIAADQISAINATWAEEPAGPVSRWVLKQLDVTCADGTQISGTPTWHLHYSVAMVVPPQGRLERVTAIPLSRDFSPANFVVNVQLRPATSPAPD